MSKTEGMELKTLEHENKKQGFAEIYGVIDKRKYILEQEMKIYQVEDVESDDAESMESESSDICLSEEKKKENIYDKLSSKYGEYHYEVLRNVSFVF